VGFDNEKRSELAVNFLGKILSHKGEEVAARMARVPAGRLREKLQDAGAARSLKRALQGAEHIGFIAEIKKASPSAGQIRENFDPVEIARSYTRGGAEALSVLTEEKFFGGSLSFIAQIRRFVPVPILRKDFMIDPYQILEARAYGADAVLLIVAALADGGLEELLQESDKFGMEALVEVHDEVELERALRQGAEIIGINNRNLETFEVDISVTERLAPLIPRQVIVVAESGISENNHVIRMKKAGARGVLIGSFFMQQRDPGKALADLKEEVKRCCG
jgi:indole-3-glycerol phosphate synthase